MVKSRAEIQKAYRERLKARDNDAYLEKERERRKKNYVPSSQLSKVARIKRNLKLNETLKKHRKKKDEASVQEQEVELIDTSGYDSPGSAGEQQPQPERAPLVVQMPFVNNFPARRNGPRKRISRAISKKSKEVKQLKEDYHKLNVKYRSTQRSLQRLKKKVLSTARISNTPRSKTEAQIKDAGLSKTQAQKVRKQLLMTNVITEEIKLAKEKNPKGKQKIVRNILCGRITKKYRCTRMISKSTGICRNTIGKTNNKSIDIETKLQRIREVRKYQKDVISFLERDDNSRSLPGKADKIETGKNESTQKRTLTDYMSNLHLKFLNENPSVKLSLASFCRIRPGYILTTSFISRNSCLCTKHQNMALILKAIKLEGIDVPGNPETYAKDPQFQMIRDKLKSDEIRYSEWKRVSVEEKGKKKMVMRMTQQTSTTEQFISHFQDQTLEFQEHVSRMKTQYEQIRLLKEKLPAHHAIVHMDFAENYTCRSVEEIQSAYWHQTGVTLHPTVIYTKRSENESLQHQSVVLISDELAHNASTVVTFLKEIVRMTKEIDPDVQCIHYWTDSPTSQYRNKTIFNIVANHQQLYGIKARWNYFEAGHGKGPCDSLGGTTKQMADQAMRSGKVVIQDASDFFSWTQSDVCSMQNVRFCFVSKEDCERTADELKNLQLKCIKGTMKVHAVVGWGSNTISTRNVSCYCDKCLDLQFCSLWERHITLLMENSRTNEHRNITNAENEQSGNVQVTSDERDPDKTPSFPQSIDDVSIGQFVVAMYDGKAYVGKIIEKDLEDVDLGYKISFMEKRKNMFQWPKGGDVLWCGKGDILFTIGNPNPSGKSERMFVVPDNVLERMANY